MGTRRIRWVHLSDFHVGKDDYANRKMFDRIISHIKKINEVSAIDFIFITGDVANKGLHDEYITFKNDFLDVLHNKIGFDCDNNVFIVPGNHDVDRSTHQAFSRDEMLEIDSHYFDSNAEGQKLRKIILPRFKGFEEIEYSNQKGKWVSGEEGTFALSVEKKDLKVGIVGLNTAWLSKNENEKEKLTPGKYLVDSALTKIEGCQLKIVLGHHPLEWLNPTDSKYVKALFGKHSVIYLHGHLHDAWAEPSYGGGTQFITIQSGAAFQARDGEKWRNGLILADIDIDNNVLSLQPWVWSAEHHDFCPDSAVFPPNHRKKDGDIWLYDLPGTKNTKDSLPSNRNEESKKTSILKAKIILNSVFFDKLNNTEVVFQHKHKEQIILDDIFIFPDLKNIKKEYDELEIIISSNEFTDINKTPAKVLILGSEQSGKTSLAKTLFKKYHAQGHLPLLCIGNQINSTDVQKLLSASIKEQYTELTYDAYCAQGRQKILIIDDYHGLRLNTRYQSRLLDNLFKTIDRLIIISDNSVQYNEDKYITVSDFAQYEILPFGNSRSGELIEKWISIGRIETIEDKELYHQSDHITNNVNAIIRKNLLPRKPLYLLTVIQLLETATPSDFKLTSYGYCYQSLIQTALAKSKIKTSDFDSYINYLTELAYYIYQTRNEFISDQQLADFKKEYSSKFLVRSHDEVIGTLLISGIMRKDQGRMYFGYRYIFYFYVAKYIADRIGTEGCKKEIENLCANMHTEKSANILIFLIYHSKDQNIIDELLLHSSFVFDGTNQATLQIDNTRYLLDYIETIPKLLIEQRNIQTERKEHLKAKDELEGVVEKSDLSADEDSEKDNRILAEINRSARVVEIIGQILRNRHGSLSIEQLNDLAESAYSSGLKFLNFFFTETSRDENYILAYLQKMFKENTSFSDKEISEEARRIFLMLCYGTSFSVIKKIANSLGSDKLISIFAEISKRNPKSPAIQLIYIAILLEYTKIIPKDEISDLYSKLNDNPIAQRLLQELVIQHLYLNVVEYNDRQWISDILKIPMKTQRMLQQKNPDKII